jgi:hypothetical protein
MEKRSSLSLENVVQALSFESKNEFFWNLNMNGFIEEGIII